ncbi:hypothetical protein WHI96_02810 [Pseudonocardia tropica]|uniref:Uncharacterized protein n=1 Tax=Pseudonocardia tropica TaxID=681289 RepID=A0ABV1JPV2_9PSEU
MCNPVEDAARALNDAMNEPVHPHGDARKRELAESASRTFDRMKAFGLDVVAEQPGIRQGDLVDLLVDEFGDEPDVQRDVFGGFHAAVAAVTEASSIGPHYDQDNEPLYPQGADPRTCVGFLPAGTRIYLVATVIRSLSYQHDERPVEIALERGGTFICVQLPGSTKALLHR